MHRLYFVFGTLAALVLTLPSAAVSAQENGAERVDPALFQALRYRCRASSPA
jgi:hypothetical protein